MNRIELVTAAKSYLNRPNLADSDVATMVSAVEGELNRGLRDHPRNARRTSYTIPTEDAEGNPYTESTPILPLPADIAGIVSVFTATTKYKQYPPTVKPAHGFVERGDCLHIYPTPARGTEFFMDYMAFLEPLQGDLDKNWVSEYYSDLYLYGILKEASVYLKDDARLNLWQGEFLRRLEGVHLQGWNQNIGSGLRVRGV